jgi:hypothetical protein
MPYENLSFKKGQRPQNYQINKTTFQMSRNLNLFLEYVCGWGIFIEVIQMYQLSDETTMSNDVLH